MSSVRGGGAPEAPQLAVIHADAPPSPRSLAAVELVNYTGSQSHVSGISSRRKIGDARAARSEVGSILGWG